VPNVIIIAGPNGAGKTTAAPLLLQRAWGVTEFVNADFIAQGISVFNPGEAAMEAGRVMLKRLHQLADEGADFTFETTLASRSFAPWIAKLIALSVATFARPGCRACCGSCRARRPLRARRRGTHALRNGPRELL
jgi:hypothetical protein